MKKENFSVARLCRLAVLTALQIVLARFVSINTMGLRIGFSFVPVMLAAYLYGPVSAGLVSALADLLGALLFPSGPFHPGFTAMAFAMGVVSGTLLDLESKNDLRYWLKAVASVVINNLVIGLLINTAWVAQLYGSRTYTGWLLYRLGEYAVMVPVQIVLAPLVKVIARRLKPLR